MGGRAVSLTTPEIAQLLGSAERVSLSASLILDVVDGYASAGDPAATPVRPLGTLRYSLVAFGAGTKNVQSLDPPVTLATVANPSGYQLWFGGRADGGPRPDPGSYTLRIDSDFYAPFLSDPVQIPTPDQAVRCTLQPGYAYPFSGSGLAAPAAAPTLLRGTVQSFDGAGQAGVAVAVTAGANVVQYVTDASGQFVLVIPDPAPPSVTVDMTDAGGSKTTLANIALTPGTTTAIPQTVLTGRVLSTVTGGSVQLGAPPATVSVAPNGTWRIVLPLDQKAATVTVSAAVPGQRKKSQSKIKITPGQVVTVLPFVFNP